MARPQLTLIFYALAVFSANVWHTVHCENDQSQPESKKEILPIDPPPETDPVKLKRESSVEKEITKKDNRTVIIVAEKVDNPPNWNSWTPVPQNSTNWLPTSFTPSETGNAHRPFRQQHRPSESHYTKGAKKTKKPTVYNKWRVEDIQSRVIDYGKMLFSNFMAGMATGGAMPPGMEELLGVASEFSSSSSSHGYGGHGGHEFGHEEGRGIVSWLSRLIGVDGKSLGDFLRKYQVHVLYDLVFTFFKWIFFLYAGFLIP